VRARALVARNAHAVLSILNPVSKVRMWSLWSAKWLVVARFALVTHHPRTTRPAAVLNSPTPRQVR
jgi:hypothetical protein